MLCTVTTTGSPPAHGPRTPIQANGETAPVCTCTTSGRRAAISRSRWPTPKG